MRRKYCECGRKIIIHSAWRGVYFPRDDDHFLCQQCYKSERDRAHAKSKGERHGNLRLIEMDGVGN